MSTKFIFAFKGIYFMENFEDKREKYLKSELLESSALKDPIKMFQSWMVDAINDHVVEPNAMVLATVDAFGAPEVRTVLLKEIIESSFVFYTNYGSNKAQQIESNPLVSLLFLWKKSERQVRVSGYAEKLSPEKSTDYFQKRPRGSQMGAWVSPQSREIESREELNVRLNDIEKRFKDIETLERPEFWGGYRVVPQKIEFWQGRDNRLHDRLLYEIQADKSWVIKRLAP